MVSFYPSEGIVPRSALNLESRQHFYFHFNSTKSRLVSKVLPQVALVMTSALTSKLRRSHVKVFFCLCSDLKHSASSFSMTCLQSGTLSRSVDVYILELITPTGVGALVLAAHSPQDQSLSSSTSAYVVSIALLLYAL